MCDVRHDGISHLVMQRGERMGLALERGSGAGAQGGAQSCLQPALHGWGHRGSSSWDPRGGGDPSLQGSTSSGFGLSRAGMDPSSSSRSSEHWDTKIRVVQMSSEIKTRLKHQLIRDEALLPLQPLNRTRTRALHLSRCISELPSGGETEVSPMQRAD